jgi:hypothetical protein
MRRLSPITIATALLAAAVIGGGGYLVSRPRHHAGIADPPVAAPPDPPARVEAIEERPQGDVRLRPPALAPLAIAAPEPPPSVTSVLPAPAVDALPPAMSLLRRRQQALAAAGQRATRDADERLFETLRLPETTRAAVRQVNDESERSGGDVRARRAALETLLGSDAAKAFDAAEFDAVHRLRVQTRRWAPQDIEARMSLLRGAPGP